MMPRGFDFGRPVETVDESPGRLRREIPGQSRGGCQSLLGSRCRRGAAQRRENRDWSFEPRTNPFRIAAAIEHGLHPGRVVLDRVVDGVGEDLGEKAVRPEDLAVNSRMEGERINVGEQRIEIISAQTGLLLLVEREPNGEVFAGGRKEFDLHNNRSRSSFFVASQSTYFSRPSSTR